MSAAELLSLLVKASYFVAATLFRAAGAAKLLAS